MSGECQSCGECGYECTCKRREKLEKYARDKHNSLQTTLKQMFEDAAKRKNQLAEKARSE